MSRRRVAARWLRDASDLLAIEEGCWFDLARGERVVAFLERFCRQSKGRWGGTPLKLLPWQRDLILRLYGWVRPDGTRRFRRCYVLIPKKNGKSTLVSGLTLYHLVADGEKAPEVYCNAVDREQAGIVFDEAARMIAASPSLSGRFQVVPSKKRIVDPVNHGKIQANSADVPSKDGVNASAWSFDEIHRLKNPDLYDIFRYAGASRTQPLELGITTAGEEESGVWFDLLEYSEQVASGEVKDTSHLGVIYRADPEVDDLEDPATWSKANPSMGHTIDPDDFAREFAEAKLRPDRWASFLRLRLNVVIRSTSRFLDLRKWDACGRPIPEADLAGLPCFGGVDLSTTTDLTAWSKVIPTESGIVLKTRCYIPEGALADLQSRDKRLYRQWVDSGDLVATPGDTLDYEWVRNDILADASRYDLRAIGCDPWNANQFAQRLQTDGIRVEFVRQTFAGLTAATKELDRLVASGRLLHDGNPCLRWQAGNAKARLDPAGNVMLAKDQGRSKIDGIAAAVNAIAVYLTHDEDESVYTGRGLLTL